MIVHNDDRVVCGYWNCYAVCFGNYRFYDYWLAGFAYSCKKGFFCDYQLSDPWIHNVSNCFARRFHFGYEAQNEQIENSCHANCFAFRLSTWSSAVCGLLNRNDFVDGPLKYYDLGSYPVKSSESVRFLCLSRESFLWCVERFMLSTSFLKDRTTSSIVSGWGIALPIWSTLKLPWLADPG